MEKLNKDTIDYIFSNYIDEVVVGNNLAKYCLLKDENEKIKIFNNFACGLDGLIPQPWLGNIIKPKIVILGKNPGFVDTGNVNDITDNAVDGENSIRDYLIANLENCNDKRTSLRFHVDNEKEDTSINSFRWLLADENHSSLSEWWKKFFGLDEQKPYNYKDIRDKLSDEIAVFNYYGYYSKFMEKELDTISSNLDKIDFKQIIKKDTILVFLWGGARDFYENILQAIQEENRPENIYIANYNSEGKCRGIYKNFTNNCCMSFDGDIKENDIISKLNNLCGNK